MEKTLRRTWAEIDLSALADNYRALRAQAGGRAGFLGVVKADAYGHGAVPVARKLEELGCEYLAVSNLEEAQELRLAGIRMPILLLGYTPPEMTAELIENRVTQDVPSLEIARAYSRAAAACGGTLTVHLKLDTGMGRLGFLCDDAHFDRSLAEILEAMALPGLNWEGVFTHFCVSDEPEKGESIAFTRVQYDRFCRMAEAAERGSGHTFPLHHCANSGAVAYFPEFSRDLTRPGIVLYGTGPVSRALGLRPVMTLRTAVGPVRVLSAGTSVSYGRTYFTEGERRIGVLPIGYADGLFRCLSNRWQVMTSDGPAPLRGRICMDMCMADLTDLPGVGTGDTVEVFGPDNPVDRMAEIAGTITYELLCAVSKRVPRIYLEDGRETERHLRILE